MQTSVGAINPFVMPEEKKPFPIGRVLKGAALAVGILATAYVGKLAYSHFTAKPVQVKITPKNMVIDVSYKPRIAKYRAYGLTDKEIMDDLATFAAETGFRHYDSHGRVIMGGAHDQGLTQMTPVALEDVVQKTLDPSYPKQSKEHARSHSIASHAVRPYLFAKDISRKDLTNFNSDHFWTRFFARRHVKNKLLAKMNDGFINFDFGMANKRYIHPVAVEACREYHVPYTPEVDDAIYNAPERTKEALSFGYGWKRYLMTLLGQPVEWKPHLLDITQRHVERFDSYRAGHIVWQRPHTKVLHHAAVKHHRRHRH